MAIEWLSVVRLAESRVCGPKRCAGIVVLTGLVCGLLVSGAAAAASVTVNNVNAPGEGFNDPTPVGPVTGNPGTTLGAQRLNAFEAAADQWGATLVSAVTIVIDAQMTSLDCDEFSAVLGSAGPNGFIASDFPNAPVANTWFPQALANALSGEDIDPQRADVSANFNQDIGTPGCLESLGWSYVIGADPPPGTLAFTTTVLHEIAHGLGFMSFVDEGTGMFCCQGSKQPDHFSRFLLDETPVPTLWPELSNNGRKDSATDDGNLTWGGQRVTEVASLLSTGRHVSGRVRMYAPATLEQGSSVSHWDTDLSPSELMEPFIQASFTGRLTNHLMLDVGWNTMLELAVSQSDDQASIPAGSPTRYVLTIAHNGPADLSVIGATVTDAFPAALNGVSWTCSGSGGASCADTSGTGNIATAVNLPLGGMVLFTVDATVSVAFTGTLTNTASIALPAGVHNTVGSSASDQTEVVPPEPESGITVSGISGDTTESGGTASFTLVLDSQPIGAVTIPVGSSIPDEGIVTPAEITFTDADWDTPQPVYVTGVNDDVDDGDGVYFIITDPAVSADPEYNGLDADDVAVINRDDDTAGITVSAVSGDTRESASTATFTVVLDSEPLSSVSIGLSSSDPGEGQVSPAELEFQAGDWNLPQQATVTGQNDTVADGDIEYTIFTAPAVSEDSAYDGLDADDVSVVNLDVETENPMFTDGFEGID